MADLHDQPVCQLVHESQLAKFIAYCERSTGLSFANYAAFEAFTINRFRTFWRLFLVWSNVICEGDREPVCAGDDCETAVFFPSLRLNYAENLLSGGGRLIGCYSDGSRDIFDSLQLRKRVVGFAGFLQQLGVEPGDRIVAIARNNVEVIVAALASAAIGAVFSSCAHDMGVITALSRFQPLNPKVLVANCASQPWDTGKPLVERVGEVIAGLSSLQAIITIDGALPTSLPVHPFAQAVSDSSGFIWQRFPFNHPLFILFSSGTTGTPKCIVHGAGGTLLEHLKEHRLHGDLSRDDRMFFQTSCGWMMWNWQLSALACGTEVVVYDGPLKGPETLWELVAEQQVTVFGTNPAYLQFTETAGYAPRTLNLAALRSVLSTGSILYPRQFDWIAEQVKAVPVQSISGGTDILGCFVLGNPLLPVYRGQAQCRSLGLDVRSIPEQAKIGELICANPFPSRPTGFYGEASDRRYHDAYFAQNPGVWTHGDLIEITPHGVIMHGRSDGVMNIRGVRIGPAEIYRILRQIPLIVEAMAVEQTDEREAGGSRLILLVVLRAKVMLDTPLIMHIRRLLAEQGTAMMVPASIIQVGELPVTHSGKRSEAAARDAVNGVPIRNRAALLNPDCVEGLAEKIAADNQTELAGDDDLEVSLCKICQRILGVPIKPTDVFPTLGDSLSILSFLIEVVEHTQTTIPLRALIGTSTVEQLASRLRGPLIQFHHCDKQIRAAQPSDEAEICHLLDEGFGQRDLPPARRVPWRRLFEHPWQPEGMPRGYVLMAGGEIVGFIGMIAALRHLNGKSEPICNLSSWFVRPDYRGWSDGLLAAAIQQDVTYTSLTPGRPARRVLQAMGFTTFDSQKMVLPLMQARALFGRRPSLIFDRQKIRVMLGDDQRRIFDDHIGYGTQPMLLKEGSDIAFILLRRGVYAAWSIKLIPYSEVLYCSEPAMLRRHIEHVKLAVMRTQMTAGLAVSQHLGISGIPVPHHTLFSSNTFAAHELDRIYSELSLLSI